MKTIDLLNSLQGREKKDFETVIKTHKRESLKKLYFFLKKRLNREDEPDKGALYQTVFGKKYSSSKGYLIRNELRLLNDELEDFLVKRQLEKAFKTNPNLYNLWLLRALKDRKLHTEFEAHYKKTIPKAQENLQYELIDKMMTLYLQHLIVHTEITEDLYENTIHAGYMERIQWVQKDAVRKIRATEVMKAFTERTIKVTQPEFPYSNMLHKVDLQLAEINDAYSNYLYLYALSFQQSGVEKITTLQSALTFIEKCQQPEMEVENRKLFLLATIALEYYLMRNYQAANDYYLQTLQYAHSTQQTLRISVVFNYFSNCIKLEEYAKAIELFETHKTVITSNERVHYRFLCLKAMCHIFLAQTDEAIICIPPNIQQRPDAQYYYFRLVQIIVFCELEDEEAAMRECQNFLKMYRYHDHHEIDMDYATIVKFFLRFAKAKIEVPLKSKTDLKKLKVAVNAFVEEQAYAGNFFACSLAVGEVVKGLHLHNFLCKSLPSNTDLNKVNTFG